MNAFHFVTSRKYLIVIGMISCLLPSQASAQQSLPGITFDRDFALYAPIRELADALSLGLRYIDGETFLEDRVFDSKRTLFDGRVLMPLRKLEEWGATIDWFPLESKAVIKLNDMTLYVVRPAKRVVIDQSKQARTAYQGDRLVLSTNVSTGRGGHLTPNGVFVAGPIKDRVHFSRLYDWAPMPWAVQIAGDVFIHGYGEVPSYPASHGCIRVPLLEGNPARWFFEWVEPGTPVEVVGQWNSSRSSS